MRSDLLCPIQNGIDRDVDERTISLKSGAKFMCYLASNANWIMNGTNSVDFNIFPEGWNNEALDKFRQDFVKKTQVFMIWVVVIKTCII